MLDRHLVQIVSVHYWSCKHFVNIRYFPGEHAAHFFSNFTLFARMLRTLVGSQDVATCTLLD